jgi:hypothetical protein
MPYWYLALDGIDSYRPQSLNVRTNYYLPDNGRQNTDGRSTASNRSGFS